MATDPIPALLEQWANTDGSHEQVIALASEMASALRRVSAERDQMEARARRLGEEADRANQKTIEAKAALQRAREENEHLRKALLDRGHRVDVAMAKYVSTQGAEDE